MTDSSKRRVAATVLVVALACLAAAQPASARPDVGMIYHQVSLPAGPSPIQTVSVTCPAGYLATTGMTFPLPAGVTVVKTGVGGGKATFRIDPGNTAAATVMLVVSCVKSVVVKTLGKGKFRFKTPLRQNVGTQTVNAVANTPVKAVLRCPAGSAPAGVNFDSGPAASGSSVSPGRFLTVAGGTPASQVYVPVRFIESMPVRGGWDVDFFPATDGTVKVSLNCLKRSASATAGGRRATRKFPIKRHLVTAPLAPLVDTHVVIDCPRNTAAISPAFELPDPRTLPTPGLDPFIVLGAAPDRSTGKMNQLATNGWPGATTPNWTYGSLCLPGREFRLGARLSF